MFNSKVTHRAKVAEQGCHAPSELRVPACTEDRDGTPVTVVGRIDDELIIKRHGRSEQRERVIGLDDLFRARMRQHAVADQDAEPAVVEELLVHFGNTVDDAGEPERVVRPAPLLAFERPAATVRSMSV